MARRTTIRCVAISTVVLSVGVFTVFGVGIGVAEPDTNETEVPTITAPGEADDVFSNKNRTTLENTSISYNHTDTDNSSINIFISMNKLEKKGIETDSSRISSYNISSATVSNVSKHEYQDYTVFKIRANLDRETKRITINKVTFADLDTSNINSTITSEYEIGASTNDSGKNYSDLKKGNQVTTSGSFDIVTNTIKVPDQATISSQMLADSTTSAGITISDFVSDVESVILITQGYNGTRIAGFETRSATSVHGRQNITVRPNIVGGKKRIHVIPKNRINTTKYETGDHIPESVLSSAIAADTAHIFLGTVEFPGQIHNNTISSNLTVEKTELLDLNGDNTPYIVSIHPITSDGDIVYDSIYGRSSRLTGESRDIRVPLESTNSTNTKIYSSNQLAATLQIYGSDTEKDVSHSNSTFVLPNSDIDEQFVNGGVSDTARIQVEEGTEPEDREIRIDNRSAQSRIYSGTTIIANSTLLEGNSKKLYRIDESTRIISAVGDPITNSSSVRFSTRGLQTGKYTFSENGSESKNSFKIIGSEDRYTELQRIDTSPANGGKISVGVQHNSPKPVIQLSSIDTNTTAATIKLLTPEEGQTTLGINTYAAATGSLNESVTVTGPGASIESVTTPSGNGTLPPGDYEIEVRSEQGIATTSDNATMTLTRRSTNGLTTYAGTEADESDLGSAAAVRDAIESDALSPAERVSANDTVVYAVNASGLTGLPAARNATPETGADLDRLDGLEFGVRSTAEEDEVTASDGSGDAPRDSTVHVDETGLYVVADAEDALSTDGEPEPGEEFTAEFRVTDDRLREAASDPPDGHRVSSTVAFTGAEQGDSSGGDGEQTASGGPVGGGGGGGTGGAGGAAGGSGPARPPGGDRPNGPNAEGGGNGDRIDPVRGVGFEPRPNAERRTPLLDGPIAVSAPTASGMSKSSEPTGTGTSATDVEAADPKAPDAGSDEDGGSETTSIEPDGDDSKRPTPTYENAPVRTTAEDLPGFGSLHSLAALALALLAATRSRRGH